jgi:hypothetical protein
MNIIWHNELSGGDRLARAFVAVGLILAAVLLFIVPPEKMPFDACEFYSLTGHSCLTCGMTRSLHAISHGELSESVRYHLMGPSVLLVMLLSLALFSLEAVSGKRLEVHTGRWGRRRVVLTFAIVWLTYWGVRLVTEFAA